MEDIQENITFLKSLIKGIAAQFGENCEVVLHDLKKPFDQTIEEIENGHVTGRKIGGPGTNLGLELISGNVKEGDKYNYIAQTRDGKILRSSSIYIYNKSEQVIGSVCINLDITEFIMAEKTIQTLTKYSLDNEVKESFVTNVADLLDILIQESNSHVGKPVAMMSKQDKMKGILFLDEKGAFLIKKAGDRIASFFDISKYTLYNYLEEARSSKKESP
ncbi:transcriptional regulator [bacterium LRH843]|nr:transcriptional regulator [bacterium LRH843]